MLSDSQLGEVRHFLNRLQGKEVRVEMSSRLNIGYRVSFSVKLEAGKDTYSFVSSSGDVSVFLEPVEAEAYSVDSSSVSLLYGDDLITVRYARKR